MQVEAIYDQGRLEFVRPLRVKHDRVRLVVTVPGDELEAAAPFDLPPEVLTRAQARGSGSKRSGTPPRRRTKNCPS